MDLLRRLSRKVRERLNTKKDKAKFYAIFGAGNLIGGTITSIVSFVNNRHQLGLCTGVAFCTMGGLALTEAFYSMREEWQREKMLALLQPEIFELLRKYLALFAKKSEEDITDEMINLEGIEMVQLARREMGRSVNENDLKNHLIQDLNKRIRYYERISHPERFQITLPDEVHISEIYLVLRYLGEDAAEHYSGYVPENNRIRLVPYSRGSLERYEELLRVPSPSRSKIRTSLLTQQIAEMDQMRASQIDVEKKPEILPRLNPGVNESEDEYHAPEDYLTPCKSAESKSSSQEDLM